MDDCENVAERLRAECKAQIGLAMVARAPSIIEMHIDLAAFAEERIRLVEEHCDEERPLFSPASSPLDRAA